MEKGREGEEVGEGDGEGERDRERMIRERARGRGEKKKEIERQDNCPSELRSSLDHWSSEVHAAH